MKITAIFTVYNGLELLENAANSIAKSVDEVLICYQNTSNKGEINPYVGAFCSTLGYQCFEFTPDLALNTKQNERNKHDLMLQTAKKQGFTHAILMATDHFYTKEQVDFAKKDVIANDWDITATAMFTYYKQPNWRVEPIEDYFMPFIIALRPNTQIERVANFPWLTDPSVQINTCQRHRMYETSEVILHHYSMVRIDIADKFRNAAASIRWKPDQVDAFISEFENAKLGDSISYFKGRVLVESEYYFTLPNTTSA
jgi:hypothetical protein